MVPYTESTSHPPWITTDAPAASSVWLRHSARCRNRSAPPPWPAMLGRYVVPSRVHRIGGPPISASRSAVAYPSPNCEFHMFECAMRYRSTAGCLRNRVYSSNVAFSRTRPGAKSVAASFSRLA